MVRKHIFFYGRVQGVGFRYRAYYMAQSLGLTGWVRNLWDERVEMEVQGKERDIDQLLNQLHEQRFIQIDYMEIAELPCKPEAGFEIAN